MLGIDGEYDVGRKIGLTHFIPKGLNENERKRLKTALKKVVLEHQIEGEAIPSRIDSNYNCQVIMFLNIALSHIKEAKFVGDVLQKEIKPLCVFRFYDENYEVYHLGEKRLHAIEKEKIVVESTVTTLPESIYYGGELLDAMEDYAYLNKIINKQDKVALYMEMLVKIYLLNQLDFLGEQRRYFGSKIWYSSEQVIKLYDHLKK